MKKIALITGASAGIGKATARMLANEGYIVYATARRVELMDDLKPMGIRTFKMDVSQDDSMVQGIGMIIAEQGRIDVLINNAGYGSYGSLEDTPMSEAKYQMEVNVFGLARMCQLVIPHMRKQGSGKILNVTSVAGKACEPHGSWYHASKFAVEGLSDCLRMEVKQFGIDVIVIEPGSIKTEWNTIARDNLLKVSGNTAYKDLVKSHVRILKWADMLGSKPSVIAKLMRKAILAPRPKPRYAAGRGALTILLIKWIIPDRWYDRMMMGPITLGKYF